jgi:hypothetical protein
MTAASFWHAPRELLAKVRLRRSGEMYLVVDVDLDRNLVELLSITGTQHLVPDVPFAAIHELVDERPDNP